MFLVQSLKVFPDICRFVCEKSRHIIFKYSLIMHQIEAKKIIFTKHFHPSSLSDRTGMNKGSPRVTSPSFYFLSALHHFFFVPYRLVTDCIARVQVIFT